MRHTELVVRVCLAHVGEVARESVLALHRLYLVLHARKVGGEVEGRAVREPNVVVWLAFYKLDAFCVERGVEIGVSFSEEVREQEEGWALVEALRDLRYFERWGKESYVAIMVDERAPSTSKVILFDHCDFEARFREARCSRNAADTCAYSEVEYCLMITYE